MTLKKNLTKEDLFIVMENLCQKWKLKFQYLDSALMFGDMVFEMTRSFNKKQFKLKEHIQRLLMGVKIFRIPLKLSEEELINICHETIKVNEPFSKIMMSIV